MDWKTPTRLRAKGTCDQPHTPSDTRSRAAATTSRAVQLLAPIQVCRTPRGVRFRLASAPIFQVHAVECESRSGVTAFEGTGTEMKARNKHTKKCQDIGVIRKNGRVDLPTDFSDFTLGQRVYLHLRRNEVALSARPKRTFNGRLLSCRIRRGLRTLALYGPRSGTRPTRG